MLQHVDDMLTICSQYGRNMVAIMMKITFILMNRSGHIANAGYAPLAMLRKCEQYGHNDDEDNI